MSSERIPWFDNAKGLLIFLVVFGHSIESFRHLGNDNILLTIYNVIYSFHMPLFILISGYFYRAGKFYRTIQYVIVFFIWQIIDGFLAPLIDSGKISSLEPGSRLLNLLNPNWTLWFLIGMIFWRMVTPYVMRLKFPLLISIVAAIWISYIDHVTGWFSIRKLINFYPYFIMGYLLAEKGILTELSKYAESWRKPLRWLSLTVIIGFVSFMVYITQKGFDTTLLFMRDSFGHFHWSLLKGSLLYIFLYSMVALLCISFMLIIPQKKKLLFFDKFGINSLYIFLIHANFIRIYRKLAPSYITHHVGLMLFVSGAYAFILCWLITQSGFKNLFNQLIEPDLNWIIQTKERKPKQMISPY